MKKDFKKLVNDNDENERNLKDYHQNEIKKCLSYVRSKGVSQYNYEILRKDLISMCFEREIRDEVIDFSNIKTFCEACVEKYHKNKVIAILYFLASCSLVNFIFDLLFSNINEITTMTLGRCIAALIIAFFSFCLPPDFVFSAKKKNIVVCLAILLLMVLYVIFYIIGVKVFFEIPSWLRVSYNILFFTVISVVWNRYRYSAQ